MVNTDSYTPLESLFLYQSFRIHVTHHGIEAFKAAAFQHVSADLVNNRFIKAHPTFDEARLRPERLKELFLQLLQEELKAEFMRLASSPNAEGPNSAPQVKTLQDAREHFDKLVQTETKLYNKYRDVMLEAVHKDTDELIEEQKKLEQEERLLKELEAQEGVKQRGGNAAHSLAGDQSQLVPVASRDPGLLDGKSLSHSLPSPHVQGDARKSPVSPLPQPSPARPIVVPTPQSQIQTPVAQPGQFSQVPIRTQESPKVTIGSPQVLQPPQGAPSFSPLSGPGALPQPTSDILKRPEGTLKSKSPVSSQPTMQVPVPGTLKWETPYQPPSNPQQQRSSQDAGQYTSQQAQQQRSPQAPLQYPSPQPLQPHPQGLGQPASQAKRPVLVAPQPAGQIPPPIQPAPIRSHPGSLVVGQQPRPSAGPSTPGQARQGQQNHPQTMTLSLHNRAPSHSAPTLPPMSSATAPPSTWVSSWAKPPSIVPPPPRGPNDPYISPYHASGSFPAVPQHILQQQAMAQSPASRHRSIQIGRPQTPASTPIPSVISAGSGTRWKTTVRTPSTPRPSIGEIPSPAVEPLSPVLPTANSLPVPAPQLPYKSHSHAGDAGTSAAKKAARSPRSAQRGIEHGESSRGRRSMSAASLRDENMDTESPTKVKREEATPRPFGETGDTDADESVSGQRQRTTPRPSRTMGKRKRQESPVQDTPFFATQAPAPPAIPTHVLWYRSFHRASASSLDQIVSNRDANMFANAIREKDAPSYLRIVLRPKDLKAIRAAIIAGNRAGSRAAAALPGGDPGDSSLWLPIAEDLVPPRGIINSAHLERELVHMFANAIMYNPDPHKGLGPGFMPGSDRGQGANDAHGSSHTAGGDPNSMVGYQVDENSVVKQSQAMFVEVEKLLSDLRSTEAKPGRPPAPLPPGAVPASERLARGATATSTTAQTPGSTSAADTAEEEDDGDAAAGDRDAEGSGGTAKRRRIGRG